jgi:hypothetical protein
MADPPYGNPEHGNGDGPRANDHRPHRCGTRPFENRSSMTLTSQPPAQSPFPHQDPGPNGWIDFLWRLTGDHRRAACVLAFTVVFLAAFAVVTALLAPHVGTLGVLGGLGAGGAGSAALEVVRRRRRNRDDPEEG